MMRCMALEWGPRGVAVNAIFGVARNADARRLRGDVDDGG
jgi:NAD(P)-dependent dehydrogenase (short-subunit alcohol dehydrogenase family)